MIIRKNFLPKGLHDIAGTTFLVVIIPVIYFFEIFIVLPEIYGNTLSYYVHSIIGTFLLSNIIGNFMGVILCDTSIRKMILIPTEESDKKLDLWHLCSTCEAMVPPRSWHCSRCKTCILKRDHHCNFTGCCIGFKNHRYFVMLLFYLCLSTAYANLFNNYFIWVLHQTNFLKLISVVKLFFPLAMLMVDQSENQIYLFIYLVSMIGMLFTGVLLVFHIKLVLDGTVIYERNNPAYNLGKKENIRMVFGKKWYLTWISPFIDSQLPHDGIHFENLIQETAKAK